MRAMEALIKQYAPSEDDAWNWARTALGMGWVWDEHTYATDMGAKRLAVAFRSRQHLGLIGVCLVAGAVRWAWFSDEGKGDGLEYDDPVACAVVCEMTFGSTKSYEPAKRNERWQEGTI